MSYPINVRPGQGYHRKGRKYGVSMKVNAPLIPGVVRRSFDGRTRFYYETSEGSLAPWKPLHPDIHQNPTD